MTEHHRQALATCAAAAILAMQAPPAAHAQAVYQFNIPAQPMASALRAYGQASRQQIAFSGDVVAGKRSRPVVGALSADDGLRRLIEGSGLSFRRTRNGVVVVEAASSPAEAAAVGSRPPASALIDELIVTAQKREQRVIDVPISIVAIGSDELQRRQIKSMDDLSTAVPGLAVQSVGAWTRRITIRGVSNVFGASSLIGLYLDEASVTSGADLQLDLRTYDLERVEVLRGPQGTLYGEGSVGGTVRFITRDPDLTAFGGQADVAALFTHDGGPSQRIETVLNVPVVEGVFGLRVAGVFEHMGGWIDQPRAGRSNINDQNVADVRVKALWTPTPELRAAAMAIVHRNNGSTNTGEDARGEYTQVFNLTTSPAVEDDYEVYNLTLSYDLAGLRLLGASTYIDQDRVQRNYGYRLPSAAPPAPLSDVLKPFFPRKANIFSQEVRLTSTSPGPLDWTIGGFFRHSRITNYNSFNFGFPGPVGSPLPALTVQANNTQSKSWAVFGDASYDLTDRLTLGGGLRYFHDEQEFRSPAFQAGRFHSLNPRAYAQFRAAEGVNVYASAAKGLRSGGFNALNQPSYEPERVWTYELGSKVSVAEGRIRADLAVFYTDYGNYQINGFLPLPAPRVNIISNAGDARIKGVELGLTFRPTTDWTLTLNGQVARSRFHEIDTSSASYQVGDPLDLFPRYSYTVSVQRDFAWLDRPGAVRLDYNELGRMTYRNRRNGAFYFSRSNVINLLNLDASIDWSESLTLGVFAQNLLNDRGYLDPFSIEETAARARPRTVGFQLGARF